MTAYFTDPMSDEIKKALEEELKKVKASKKEDPDAIKRARESKQIKEKSKKGKKQRFSRKEAVKLR